MKKSKLGYKRHSPDVNNPYNVIPSGRITMKDVDFPVYGVDDIGYAQIMYPGGEYQFPGNEVFEMPVAQFGMSTKKVDRFLNANKDLNWVQRLYEPNTPSIQIPGQQGLSTHFMESADGRVYPTVVQMPDGNLQYLGENAYDYADETGEYIQFNNDRQARRFAKNYKKGTGVLDEFGSGGLKQWFDEKWVDVKTGKECGRSGKDKNGRPYPACRPSRRVNSTTPKTTSEMSSSEKAKFKREKTSGQRINYNHKRAQQGGQMSASAGYDSWYNSPMAAGRYTFNPKDPAEYYVEGYGTKQGPGIAAGMDYTNPKFRTQAMLRAGLDPEIGASLRAQGGYRFNPIDNRREQLTWGPYGGVRFQTEDYQQGVSNQLGYNNLQTDLAYGVNARYNKALANRGRFSIEGDLGMAMGKRPEGNLGEGLDPRFYGAVKAIYSPPMYKNTRNRKPGPTTYSSGYQMGGFMMPEGLSPAFFTGMKDAVVDAFKSFMASPDEPVAKPKPTDWRKLSRPEQIDYGIRQIVALEDPKNRKAVENLLQATAYMENTYGTNPKAYGRNYTSSFMSIDPIALTDMFTGRGNQGAYNAAQQRQFENFKKLNLPTDKNKFNQLLREDNPVAAMAAARYRYALSPQALPDPNNSRQLFDYWLKNYNGNGILKYKSREEAFKDFQKAYQKAISND
jgi:hypothetical protein